MPSTPVEYTIPRTEFDPVRGKTRNIYEFDFGCDGDINGFTTAASGTGASAPTTVSASSYGGLVSVATGTADDSRVSMQSKATVRMTPGKRVFIVGRFKADQVTQNDIIFGLYVTDTDPIGGIASGGGVWWLKDDDAATWECNKQVVTTKVVVADAVATLVVDTYNVYSIVVDVTAEGRGNISWFIDGTLKAFAEDVTLPASTVDLRASFCHQAGDANGAYTAVVDYIVFGEA